MHAALNQWKCYACNGEGTAGEGLDGPCGVCGGDGLDPIASGAIRRAEGRV
jgi:hypothetical protein